MDKYMNDEILAKTDELVEYIKNSKTFKKYQELKEQVKENTKIMNLINEVKTLQKKAVKKEYNKEDVADINNQISNKLKELDSYPIYKEMTYLEEDLNNLFVTIKDMLDIYISKQIN